MSQDQHKVHTPLDLQVFFHDVLKLPPEKLEALFDFGEDKQGYVYAQRKRSTWLPEPQFKTLAKALTEIGGEYVREKGIFRLLGPGFKKPRDPYYDEAKPKPSAPQPPSDVRSIPFQNMLPVKALLSMPFVSRQSEDPELAELVESIKTYGVLEPIVVRPKSGGAFEVVAGARRLRAAKEAGLIDIPVVIKTLTDDEALIIQLIENVQRKDLSEEEKTRTLQELAKRTKWTPQEIADHLNMSYTWVMKYLPDEFKDREQAEYGQKGGEARAEEVDKRKATQRVATSEVQEAQPVTEHRAAEVLNPRWSPPELTRQPEVTMSIPAPPEEPPEPKPEALDVADFTCPECHRSFRISHVASNLHRLVPIKEEPA